MSWGQAHLRIPTHIIPTLNKCLKKNTFASLQNLRTHAFTLCAVVLLNAPSGPSSHLLEEKEREKKFLSNPFQ